MNSTIFLSQSITDYPAIVVLIAVIVLFLIYMLIMKMVGGLWLQAYFSRANITFAELIGMYLRKEDAKTIVKAKIMAVQGGLEITTQDLERHLLVGGDVLKVVQALILAKKHTIEFSYEDAIKIDLIKERDVLEEIKAAAENRT